MTAQDDLDRTLGAWLEASAAAAPVPPEPLARTLEATRGRRPRPTAIAGLGSGWVDGTSSSGAGSTVVRLRPVVVVALVALLVLAVAGAAVMIGGRLLAPHSLPVERTAVGRFSDAPDLSQPMASPVVAPLLDGRVLVIGAGSDGEDQTPHALLYDPATGASTPVGPIVSGGRSIWAALRLQDGRVLLSGDGDPQVFDPATTRFAPVGPMVERRAGAGVALLHDGRVLFAGGWTPGGGVRPDLSSAELCDPVTNTFSATGAIGIRGYGGAMATLPDGRVFAAPFLTAESSEPTAEIYDPGTEVFSAGGTLVDRPGDGSFEVADAVVIPDGRVLVVGSARMHTAGRTAIWDPTTRTFSPLADAPGPVSSATLLADGRVLLTGGKDPAWAGIYDPMTARIDPIAPPAAWRPSMVRLADGRVLAVGGLTTGEVHQDPVSGGCCTMAPSVATVQIFQ